MDGTNEPSFQAVTKLPPSVIRSISTGQMVQNVAAACKELIENALDAGATKIGIHVADHGVSSLEICDNGTGIQLADFEVVAQAHWTSKLSNYDELGSLKTYGFRGEALSALAALSNLTITTRHGNVQTATKLQFDHNGLVLQKTPCARTVGTTTMVERFLEPLAVRRKEFERNAKSEFQKLLHVVQSYCLIARNVQFELIHRVDNKKTVILSTYPNRTLKENICNVFTAKQLEVLIDFVQIRPTKEQLSECGFEEDAPVDDFKIEGLVSSISKGSGRSTTDRQFVYINRRPCDVGKMLRTINEVYHQYNRQQYPAVVLNIEMEKGKVDVNVTPDKRQVLITNENLLYFVIKTSLINLYDKLQGVCKLGEASSATSVINAPSSYISPGPLVSRRSAVQTERAVSPLDRFERQSEASGSLAEPTTPVRKQLRMDGIQVKDVQIGPRNNTSMNMEITDKTGTPESTILTDNSSTRRPTTPKTSERTSPFLIRSPPYFGEESSSRPKRPRSMDSAAMVATTSVKRSQETSLLDFMDSSSRNTRTCSESSTENNVVGRYPARCTASSVGRNGTDSKQRFSWRSAESDDDADGRGQMRPPSRTRCVEEEQESRRTKDKKEIEQLPLDTGWSGYRKCTEIPFSFEQLAQRCKELGEEDEEEKNYSEIVHDMMDGEREFHARITPDDNQRAELELKLCLVRTDFANMKVIGQFNLGFIIARLGADVFIIDQHASDEKYNFEQLQKTASVQCQKLITPLSLELSPAQEQILKDRYDVFDKNGFELVMDNTRSPGKRFRLSAIPCVSSCTFDKSDLDEMIAILDDDRTLQMYRPTKMRRVFASKACRKSIMIGRALNKFDMQKVLRHMSETEQPWNCPHGRPTVRHLLNLRQIPRLRPDE